MEAACGNLLVFKEDEDKERHKHVEMKYRKQMKDRFEDLLRALPDQNQLLGGEGATRYTELDKKMTRSRVLDLAKSHIDCLDRVGRELEKERDLLNYQVGLYETAWRSVLDGQGRGLEFPPQHTGAEIGLQDNNILKS